MIGRLQTKSCELDSVPTYILKDNINNFIQVLTKLVNLSLTTGVCVDDWKVAILRPLLKRCGLDRIDVNYRLVSNLPFVSKIAEMCVMDQFEEHCNINNFTPNISQCIKNQSCETALVKIANDALWAIKKGNTTLLVIIDLSVAWTV